MDHNLAQFLGRVIWLVIFAAATIYGGYIRYRPTREQRDFEKLSKQCYEILKQQLGDATSVTNMYDKQYKRWANLEATFPAGLVELYVEGGVYDVFVTIYGPERFERHRFSMAERAGRLPLPDLLPFAVELLRSKVVYV